MRRRDFIKGVAGSAIAWPLAARAQQPAVPVVGLLDQRSPEELADRLRGFRQGLRDSGFVEGQNVAIDYRWAENKLDRLHWRRNAPVGTCCRISQSAMRRRDFIKGIVGSATALPLAARAQQPAMRRIGVLTGLAETDPFTIKYMQELRGALQKLGWTDSQNIQFSYRYAAGDPGLARAFAKELVDMQPDLIVGHTTPVAAALSQTTRTIPVVFVSITDPVRDGFVASMARPGGNMTGFTNYEFSMGAKWLEILKEIAPNTARVSLMLNPDTGAYYVEYLHSIEAIALSHSVQATLAPVHNSDEIERTITALGSESGGGLIVLPSAPVTAKIQQIIESTARNRVPAIYPFGSHAKQGGLAAYGVELNDLFRQAAGYVDRILKGEKPADLPVQAPTRFELIINLKTAKALGLSIPQSLLATADEVIE